MAADPRGARDPRIAMERMYRHQRHIYDLTRKFYLLGRDRLIRRVAPQPGDRVCEVGCGTARNLIALARRYPEIACYGIDASAPMLATAQAAIDRAGLGHRIALRHALAEELDPQATFGLTRPFDLVIFAYSLSMIPSWPAALDRALASLRPGGTLAIVDFGDQRGLPRWFARALRRWLALFDVHPRAELAERLGGAGLAALDAAPVFRGYAIELRGTKAA